MARPTSKPQASLKSPRETAAIMALLFEQHPNAFTELDFRTPFELLAATIMSAQSTDKRVNEVTPALFKKYPDARAMAQAPQADLERDIITTGFFRQKAKALIGMAQALVAQHGGEVPADMDALTSLPGVGRKTANVVLGHALGVPGLPVDRHVLRVANRIGIAQAQTPEEVEAQLTASMPREQWTLTSDTLILHGRRICRPRPLCEQCRVVDHCEYARAWYKTAAAATATAAAPAKSSAAKPKPKARRASDEAAALGFRTKAALAKTPKLEAAKKQNSTAAKTATTSAVATRPRLVAKADSSGVTARAASRATGTAGANKPGRRATR
jgi:endonuclease-3